MKAAKITEIGKIEIAEVPVPEIKNADDVLVQVKAVGVCGTDLHIFKAGRADVAFPRIMGHELSGIVVKTGEAVKEVKEGDKVVLDPVFACDECDTCKSGHANVCPNVKCYGVQMDGGYQEMIVVGEKHLYKLGDNVGFDTAALAEPFSIASNIVNRAGLKAGEKMLIIGAGTIGISVLQAAKLTGAEVVVSDVIDKKLQIAKKLGADMVINSKETSLKEALEEKYAAGFDVVIDAVGITPLFQQSIDYAAPCARIMSIGFDANPAQIPPVVLTKKELTIVGSRMNNHRFPEVIGWFNEGKLKTEDMITRRYPLDQIQKAFEETLADSTGSIKTIIEL